MGSIGSEGEGAIRNSLAPRGEDVGPSLGTVRDHNPILSSD